MNQTTPLPEKTTAEDKITFSAEPGLISGFAVAAQKIHGARGKSKAGREAMQEWLDKRGIKVDGEAAAQERAALKKIAALRDLGVDADRVLDDALMEAGQPALMPTGTGN